MFAGLRRRASWPASRPQGAHAVSILPTPAVIALVDDIEIAYEDIGSGTPVLLVHGFPHNGSLWAPQLGALVGRGRCLAPDLRGFGRSSVRPPWSMDRFADDLAALLDVARVDRAVVVGLSMGGYITMAFWRRHRERVRALVLAGTRAGADSAEAVEKRRELARVARTRGPGAVADAMLPGMVGKTTREKHPEVAESVHAMLASAPVEGIVGALEAMIGRPDSTPTLATIDVPTLVVVGEEDALTPVKEAEFLRDRIRGARLEVIPSAGHVCNLERPASFNHVLSEFLGVLTLE
jgi:3-oxoadipate enol-lactonase